MCYDGRTNLQDLLQQSDVVSLHCPLTDATQGLIGAAELRLMKPNAILINTARGGLVDSEALVGALATGEISAAAIDVLPQEPPVARIVRDELRQPLHGEIESE